MKLKRLLLACFLLCTMYYAPLYAQTGNITGTVVDDRQQPLPGVNISVKDGFQGTVTDENGQYELVVNNTEPNDTLLFSYVGYEPQSIAIAGRSVINIVLQEGTELEEVVVVGYGTVRKSDLTGSVASVKAEEINAFPATNVLQALSGRAPGVQVLQNTGAPGGSVSVRIRGTNSIQGSNEPLYVVDGFPISGSNPTVLNNSDIESVEILKDASATAIYGSRGANGVIIITTKQGKAGRVQVDYEGTYSVQTLREKLDLFNAKEYATFYNEQAANDKVNPYFTQAQIDAFDEGFDWQDLIFQEAPIQTHNLTVSGGNDKTRYSIGGSIFDQEGILKGSDYRRYSVRANMNTDVSKLFTLQYNATLTNIQTNRQNNGGGNRGGSLISGIIFAPPTLTPYNDDGSYRQLSTAYPFISNF